MDDFKQLVEHEKERLIQDKKAQEERERQLNRRVEERSRAAIEKAAQQLSEWTGVSVQDMELGWRSIFTDLIADFVSPLVPAGWIVFQGLTFNISLYYVDIGKEREIIIYSPEGQPIYSREDLACYIAKHQLDHGSIDWNIILR